MIFYIHFILLTSGLSGTSVLLGVFFQAYSDASQGEIGVLLMSFPFVSIIIKPLFCSIADRRQSHQLYLILALITMLIGYGPFLIVPYCTHFYTQYPRWSWYTLVVACHIGNGGLGVAWSLGDSLAVNMAQKTNTPYGRMRLMGTVSWGFYGALIGQINEISYFPKYVPAFLILHASVLIEILLLIFWNKEDFKMCDPNSEKPSNELNGLPNNNNYNNDNNNQVKRAQPSIRDFSVIDSTPSSLGGTLRVSKESAIALRRFVLSEDLSRELKKLEIDNNNQEDTITQGKEMNLGSFKVSNTKIDQENGACKKINNDDQHNVNKNPQVVIFKLILNQDGRLTKYLALFTMFGLLLAPMNFVFLSLVEVCKERNYNFSQLAGFVLISQAAIETICFLVVPWIMTKISRTTAMTFGLAILTARYFFYTNFYYTSDISPYWALVSEWGHGISYGIFCTILADIALMFASQSKLFIPELRKMGYLSNIDGNTNPEQVREEENLINQSLRATMQAIFGGFMDGLGQGVGSLACGIVAETYSYIKLWQIFTFISLGTALILQLIEVTKSRWSDSKYQPEKALKAYEVKSINNNCPENGEKRYD